jgi:hypothetical protein
MRSIFKRYDEAVLVGLDAGNSFTVRRELNAETKKGRQRKQQIPRVARDDNFALRFGR